MDKVYCPWCGNEMTMNGLGGRRWLFCSSCNASAPDASTEGEAYAAAIRRPLQKPLTLEEAFERRILWLETAYCEKTIKNLFPVIKTQTAMYNGTACFTTDKLRTIRFNAFYYGKEWRCWSTKPTDEERKAAKWIE